MCGFPYPPGYSFETQITPPKSKPNAPEAACTLARLMERQLGYAEGHIDPIALCLFMRAYWARIAPLAHAIHDEKD